ncbi:hypothetical protein PGUG_03128 [Meyerozyma guilliermondii ATCC 6260]|uniref:DOC domain-containing protein n=1 Tax=Meyerozyma guilliermondii (strain ATCC 6260 / CBS 566 / DSM 6381 / JCM 1539 / NBRC 10279 / NRRL Y-324) TaxID=294746 RepID=A5DIM7_PICGU|nr:uncharacterized protein PGUG_03128 [Meyerozyma guilliermondii ATCC 6260]EDK39030.2 hypothetical protein PGUG_03128 [Meyerozyma guilliermondii ATCC 6260]
MAQRPQWNDSEGQSSDLNALAASTSHFLELQSHISRDELVGSVSGNHEGSQYDDQNGESHEGSNPGMVNEEQPSLEQIQQVYYSKGLEELESLKLLDLTPLANWKLSSFKPGFGLPQLRADTPESYWQSDGSNGVSNINAGNSDQLVVPHSITIQFAKRVSLERISIFTNYSLDESYTPSKIQILAGNSDGWDLSEVCTVNFNKPIGWSHIIFNRIRQDGVLKCFVVKLKVLANHQDGKDSHIRAIRCFGKRSTTHGKVAATEIPFSLGSGELLRELSLNSAASASAMEESLDQGVNFDDNETSRIINNVNEVIGFNGFQSLELKSVSSIR